MPIYPRRDMTGDDPILAGKQPDGGHVGHRPMLRHQWLDGVGGEIVDPQIGSGGLEMAQSLLHTKHDDASTISKGK